MSHLRPPLIKAPESVEIQGVLFKKIPPDWHPESYQYTPDKRTRTNLEALPVAVLGSGATYHWPECHYVPGMVPVTRNPKWEVMSNARVGWHLHATCQTQFWAQTWAIKPIHFLRDIRHLSRVPWVRCLNCQWPKEVRQQLDLLEATISGGLEEGE